MSVENGWKINFSKENVPSFDTKNGDFFSSSALWLQFCRNKKMSNRKDQRINQKRPKGRPKKGRGFTCEWRPQYNEALLVANAIETDGTENEKKKKKLKFAFTVIILCKSC
jgi:hypothetical protein